MVDLQQFAFRFRNDDGSESAATWKAAENTDIDLEAGGKVRVRLGVHAMNLFLDSASNRITTSDGNLFCVRTT